GELRRDLPIDIAEKEVPLSQFLLHFPDEFRVGEEGGAEAQKYANPSKYHDHREALLRSRSQRQLNFA
ncbi:MAG TPA: hypothetical protein VK993_08800, partial [Chthoniobacterales bacterium]|nr:hypothetical protein [Chthoniobacterales bacterium]